MLFVGFDSLWPLHIDTRRRQVGRLGARSRDLAMRRTQFSRRRCLISWIWLWLRSCARCTWWWPSQGVDHVQDGGEDIARDGNLGHLEDSVAAMAHQARPSLELALRCFRDGLPKPDLQMQRRATKVWRPT